MTTLISTRISKQSSKHFGCWSTWFHRMDGCLPVGIHQWYARLLPIRLLRRGCGAKLKVSGSNSPKRIGPLVRSIFCPRKHASRSFVMEKIGETFAHHFRGCTMSAIVLERLLPLMRWELNGKLCKMLWRHLKASSVAWKCVE